MLEYFTASLTWRVRQGREFRTVSIVMPAESASRLGSQLLREFAGRAMPPNELDVTGEVKKFHYHSDQMILLIRRLKRN